jgi:hypothetical protein
MALRTKKLKILKTLLIVIYIQKGCRRKIGTKMRKIRKKSRIRREIS